MNSELKIIILFFFISLLICMIIPLASLLLGDKSPDKEKVSVYECGFNPFHNPGEPFSVSFFLIAILFLIFDLEISYLFPWSSSSNLVLLKGQMIIYFFMMMLVMGLMYEWLSGGLEWE